MIKIEHIISTFESNRNTSLHPQISLQTRSLPASRVNFGLRFDAIIAARRRRQPIVYVAFPRNLDQPVEMSIASSPIDSPMALCIDVGQLRRRQLLVLATIAAAVSRVSMPGSASASTSAVSVV